MLTNRHHDRDAWRLHEAFGASFTASTTASTSSRGVVRSSRSGSATSCRAASSSHEVDAICPDETALHIPAHRALACADGVVRWRSDDELQFVPDYLMDDPEQHKAGPARCLRGLLELDFDLLLLAHGQPILAGGKQALGAFAGG